jgi:hypothetical protein
MQARVNFGGPAGVIPLPDSFCKLSTNSAARQFSRGKLLNAKIAKKIPDSRIKTLCAVGFLCELCETSAISAVKGF